MPGIGTGMGLGLGGSTLAGPDIEGETLSLSGGTRIWLNVTATNGDVPFTGYIHNVPGFSGLTNPPDDLVAGFGMNAAFSAPLDPTKPAYRIAFENAFKNPGDTSTAGYFENHLETIFAQEGDDPVLSRRHISIYAPRVLGDGVQHFTIMAGILGFLEHDSGAEKMNWNLAEGVISLNDGQVMRFTENDTQIFGQKNAAGNSFINIKIANTRDEHELTAAVYHSVAPTTNLFGARSCWTMFVHDLADGDIVRDMRMPSVTGSIRADYVIVEASGTVETRLRNSHATGISQAVLQTAGGDGRQVFDTPSKEFAVGLDAANSRYVIGRGTNFAQPLVAIDRTTGRTNFAGPPVLPNFAVAGVPSASASGAGAMIFVTDESGGAVPAFSDGTDWRRTTDRAIIS